MPPPRAVLRVRSSAIKGPASSARLVPTFTQVPVPHPAWSGCSPRTGNPSSHAQLPTERPLDLATQRMLGGRAEPDRSRSTKPSGLRINEGPSEREFCAYASAVTRVREVERSWVGRCSGPVFEITTAGTTQMRTPVGAGGEQGVMLWSTGGRDLACAWHGRLRGV